MSCCGQKREDLQNANNEPAQPMGMDPSMSQPGVYFEYTGATGLTVTGPVTGFRYRFTGRGDRQLIDPRDAGGMTAVPVLKSVMG